jgi:hypothetical protein
MSTQSNPIAGAYLVKFVLGNVGLPGAPVASFALVVTPASHKVTGHVQISQAIQGGEYSGEVKGTIYATGLGNVTQVVALTGVIHQDGPIITEIQFSASLAINGEWEGTGGFNYLNVHVEDAPVKRISQ